MGEYLWALALAVPAAAFIIFCTWAIVFGPLWLLAFAGLAAAGFVYIVTKGGTSERGEHSGEEATGPRN